MRILHKLVGPRPVARIFGSTIASVALLLATAAQAQISVTGSGTPADPFTATPTPDAWATTDITSGAANTYTTPEALDTGAQTLDQSTITTQIPTTAANGTARLARHNTTGGYLVTQPTGVPAAVLKATLRNDSGGGISQITVTYDYTIPVTPVTDEIPGQRVYYSLNGAPNSWTLIPEFSGITTPGTLTANLPLGLWLNGANLYLLFLDDNNLTGTDGAFTIDNFTISGVVPADISPITLTNSPASITVAERASATFTVVAGGAPRNYFWFSNDVQVPGNNLPTYTIPSAAFPANNNAQIYVVISNSLSFVTSATATLTVTPDTTPPTVVSAVGEADPSIVTVTFSEAVDPNTISEGTIQIYITGTDPGNGPITTGFTITNNNRTVIFTTNPGREAGSNYSIQVTGVLDAGSQQVPLSPDPTVIPLRQTVQLIAFDGEWKWDLNNGDRFGTGWETVGYDDSAWPSGPAGLGLDASANGVPINTILPYLADSSPAFFRRHFLLPTGTNGVTLSLRHVIEDGAVYYINGQEAARFRVNAGGLTFATRSSASAPDPTPIEGPFNLPTTNLLPGDNVIAVVIIQSGATSSDLELAVQLSATIPAFSVGPPNITTQPQGGTVAEGQSFTLTAAADGAQPIEFQWRRNGTDIPGATGSSYTLNPAVPAQSGTYTVFARNGQGEQTSSGAIVNVVPDTAGPVFVSAVGQTNLSEITLTFGEALNIDNAEDVGNYTVALTGGGGALTINSATVVNGTNVFLTTTPRVAGQNYTITLGNITDNAVTPNVAAPTSLPVRSSVIVLAPNDVTLWSYNSASNNLDGTGWQLPTFDASAWPTALAGFTTSNAWETTTNGFEIRSTNMISPSSGGPVTVYFRVPFNFPGSVAGARMRLVGAVDDGLVAYINGVEAGRLRMTNASPVSFTNLATGAGPEVTTTNIFGQTNDVHLPLETIQLTNLTGLVSGNNLLAIELHQNSVTSSDALLSVQLIAEVGVVAESGPRLNISRNVDTGAITVRWTGAGVLQQATALGNPTTTWTDVPGNPNPYTFTPSSPTETRFFSLRQ